MIITNKLKNIIQTRKDAQGKPGSKTRTDVRRIERKGKMQGGKLRSDKEFRSNAKYKTSSNIGTGKNVCGNRVKCGRYNYERG